MPVDFKTLQNMETLPPSTQAKPPSDDELVLVLVKLHKGSPQPSYVSARAKMGKDMFSAQIRAGDLRRLADDPAVESVSISRSLSGIE